MSSAQPTVVTEIESLRKQLLELQHAHDVLRHQLAKQSLNIELSLLDKAALVDESLDPLFVWRLYDGITLWNCAAEDLYGFSAAEAFGRRSHELLQTRHPLPLTELESILLTEGQWAGELIHTTKDGRTIVVDSRQRLIHRADGQLLVVESNRNITEKKAVEVALRLSEARFRDTFEQAAVGIAHVGLEGNWLLVNQRLCDIVGYSREELLKRSFTEITYPEDVERDWNCVRKLLAGELSAYDMEKRYICRDGSITWVNLTVALVRNEHDQPGYFISIVEDINSRRKAEEEVRILNATLEQRVRERTASLEEANRELEAFAYTTSHDLRAPLRTLEGFSQAILEDYGDKLDSLGRSYLDRITVAARRMDLLIQDLLNYSRLTRAELRLERVPLQSITQQVVRHLERTLQESGATLDMQENLPAVWGNSAILIQVVSNLIGNALKFIGPNVTPHVGIYTERRGEFVRVWVVDNGIGIEPRHHQSIFEVFHRLHGSEAYPGTGIGLAIVRKGIERLGGAFGLESEVGKGSRFWFELKDASEHHGLAQ